MTPRAPIAIFAFNRPDHLRRLLTQLADCEGFDESPIYVFIDGARNPQEQSLVDAVHAVSQAALKQNATITRSPVNRGLRRSIHAGVSAVCEQHGQTIVLEDDLYPAPLALNYFNAMLDRYQNEDRIWSVSGYSYYSRALTKVDRALVLPMAHPWGWATWHRAWSRFDVDVNICDSDLDSPAFKASFDLNGLYPFTRLLRNARDGFVDSWFIRWYYTIMLNGGLSIFPPQRVIQNYGISGGGAHSGRFNPYDVLVTNKPALYLDEIKFPADLDHPDYWAIDHMKGSWETRVHRFISLGGHIKRHLR